MKLGHVPHVASSCFRLQHMAVTAFDHDASNVQQLHHDNGPVIFFDLCMIQIRRSCHGTIEEFSFR